MLACFVHKENKDLSSRLTKLPQGKTQKNARKGKRRVIKEVRSVAKELYHLVAWNGQERYGNIDHQIKKA